MGNNNTQDEFVDIVSVDPQEKFDTTKDSIQEPIPVDKKPRSRRKPAEKKEPVDKPLVRRTNRVSLEKQIAAQLVSLNFFLLLTPWREDALDEEEIFALAHALNNQAQHSPRFKQALETALAAGSSGELIGVVMMIVIRRAARRELVPAIFGDMAKGLLPSQEDAEVTIEMDEDKATITVDYQDGLIPPTPIFDATKQV